MSGLCEIGSLWIGDRLGWMEQLCIRSYLDHGHRFTLFAYEPVKDVPSGVHVEPAASIHPGDRIIRHAGTGSPAYHADVFRLSLMRKTDLVWADTDAFCLRPWEIPLSGHFHGWISDDKPLVNNGVLRLPKDSRTLAAMEEFTEEEYPVPPWLRPSKIASLKQAHAEGRPVHVSELPWGVWGPNALTWFLRETGEIAQAQKPEVLYPLPFARTRALFRADGDQVERRWLTEATMSIHFWGRRFRNILAQFDGVVPAGSLLARLAERHGIAPAPAAPAAAGMATLGQVTPHMPPPQPEPSR